MFVGLARVVLQIHGARSLKDRRKVVKGLKDRLRARLPVTVAEVGDLDVWQVATLGVAVVSNDRVRCDQVLSQVLAQARSSEAVVADFRTEVLSFGSGGSGLRRGIESALDDGTER
jgi:uncharacterized protein YlxP (DUF503 family)